MKRAAFFLIAAAYLSAPARAAEWNDVRPGTFVGARLTIGGRTGGQPMASLTVAPTQSRISGNGMVSTRIGEGIALNFGARQKPTLSLAGVRADQALGLTRGPASVYGEKFGMSDGAKVALGIGAALIVAGGVSYLVLSNRCTECDQ